MSRLDTLLDTLTPADLEPAMSATTAPPTCEWFALCANPAEGVVEHPVLDYVPTCARCAAKAEAPLLAVEWVTA